MITGCMLFCSATPVSTYSPQTRHPWHPLRHSRPSAANGSLTAATGSCPPWGRRRPAELRGAEAERLPALHEAAELRPEEVVAFPAEPAPW